MLPDEVLARRAALPEKPAAVTLAGRRVTLRPWDPADAEALWAATNGRPYALGDRSVDAYDPDALVWRWMKAPVHASAAALREHVDRYASGSDIRVLTAVVGGVPVGSAALMANRPEDLKIELGSIWYGPIAQRTGVSAEVTYLLLDHAFALGYRRVEWKCDAQNQRSRRAAITYGFAFEGVQDAHYIVKRKNRDTAWFRMLDTEWPTAADRLRSFATRRGW